MTSHLDIPVDRTAYVAVVTKRRKVLALPARTRVLTAKTDRILIGASARTAVTYRLPVAGLLRRTDAWLRLVDQPLSQPAELRN